MLIRHEEVNYQNPFLCLKIWELAGKSRAPRPKRDTTKLVSWHYHEEVEFILVVDGEMEVITPEQSWTIQTGEVAILGSSQLHMTRIVSEELKYIVFQLNLEAQFDQSIVMHFKHFNERMRPLSALNAILQNNPEARRQIADAIKSINAEVNRKDKGYEISVSMLVRSILLALIRYDDQDLLAYSRGEKFLELEPVLLYIDQHLTEKISVSEACRIVNLSYHHFLRTFRNATGMSFTEYVNHKRIKRAEKLLLTEETSIDEIAYAVGIPNRAHFYELFKRYNGCSPKQFQKLVRVSRK